MEPTIVLDRLTRRFGKTTALDALCITVGPGEVHGLIGPDGAGKSTLLRIAAGVQKADSGRITIGGREPDAAGFKGSIGYMPQGFGLYTDLSLAENMRFTGRLFALPQTTIRQRSESLLRATGLWEFRDRLAGKLSGGMYRKFALVAAMLHEPAAILLDEPTNGIDPVARRDIIRLVHDFAARGTAFLISTPYMDEAAVYDTVTLLDRGRALFSGAPADLARTAAGRVVSLHADGTDNPLAIAARIAGVSEAYRVDDLIVLLVLPRTKPATVEARALKAFREAGARDVRVVRRNPVCTDAFMLLTSGGRP